MPPDTACLSDAD